MITRRSLVALLALSITLPALASAQGPERYSAVAINMSNIAPGTSTRVDFVIERWSSDAEEAGLVEAFKKGPDELLRALQGVKPRVGYIQVPGQTGWDIRYADKVKGEDGGWQIVVLTDRPIGFREAASRARTMDYPFTLVEFHVNDDGVGEGRASVYTKITWDEKTRTLHLENFSSEPVRLTEVRKVQ